MRHPDPSARLPGAFARRLAAAAFASVAMPAVLAAGVAAEETPSVAADATLEAAKQALSAFLTAHSARHTVRPLTAADPGGLPVRVRPLVADQPIEPRMTLWVEQRRADGALVARPVSFAVRAWAPGWTPVRALAVGETIQAADWSRGEVEVTAHRGAVLAALPAADARLRLPIRVGEPLQPRHVDRSVGVRRGERVAVRIQHGALDVEASAESLQDAATGADVWVKLAGSTGPVRGRVAAPGRVEVMP